MRLWMVIGKCSCHCINRGVRFDKCRESEDGGGRRWRVRRVSRSCKTRELIRVKDEPVSIRRGSGKLPIFPGMVSGT